MRQVHRRVAAKKKRIEMPRRDTKPRHSVISSDRVD